MDGPARSPNRSSRKSIVATDAASGTPIMRSTTRGTNDGSTRGRPMPSMREPGRVRDLGRVGRQERRTLRIDDGEPGGQAAVAQVPADRRARAAGARADHDPLGHGVRLGDQLLEDRLGDVVVAAPVGGALGVGELVEVVPAQLVGEAAGDLVDGACGSHQLAAAAFALDQGELVGAGRAGDHRHERQPEQPGEVRLADRRRAAGRLDDRAVGDRCRRCRWRTGTATAPGGA